MVFNYQSQVLTGIPDISQAQWSGIKMNAKVIVQSFSDYSMRLKVAEPEFWTINGQNVRLSETGRVLREQESPESVKIESITEEFKRFLLEPFMVQMKSGLVESVSVSKGEPASVTNIKKSILSQIQLDIAGTRRTEVETNTIQLPISEEGSQPISYFTTMEESIQGECLTEYTIHRLPEWRINELEEVWRMEELKVKDFNIESESVAWTVCQGKPYFLITKTKSMEQCKKSPFFQEYTSDTVATADLTSSNELGTIMSTTHTYVCGELSEFVVRKVAHKRVADQTITGYNTEERAVSPSQVNLVLLNVKPIKSRLNVPTTTEVIKSIVYGFPVEPQQLSQEIVEKTEELIGMRPMLPQPTLTQAPHNILLSLPKEKIIPQIWEQIQKMAREVYQSPESCASKSDVAGKMSILSLYMRSLSLSELELLESKILAAAESTGMKTIKQIFYEILPLVGTNPSAMLVIKKVKEGSLPMPLLTKIVSYTIRNIRYPTQELMEELIKMIKSTNVKAHKQLYTSSLLQVSNLFYHAYVNPITIRNNFPTKVYGVFGTKESPVLTEQLIPFLVEEIERTDSEHVRLSAILALGKTGHLKVLKPLIKVIERIVPVTSAPTMITKTEARRTIAVNALKRVAKMNPTEIRPILMSIIVNPAESAGVRIAAVSVFPFSQPTTAELQKLAIRSWLEPSEQVSAFIVSTLRSLAYTKVPELKIVGLKARSLIPLIKSKHFGIQHSHNINYSSVVEYLRLLISNKWELVNSKDSLIPQKMALKTVYYAPSNAYKVRAIEFNAYTYGMDYLLEKYLHFFTTEEQAASPIIEQLNKITEELKLKTRELSTPFGFVHGSWAGVESSLYLDSGIVLDALEKLTTKFESGHEMEFNHVGAHQVFDASYMFVTETGFPVMAVSTLPIIYSIKGSLKVSPMEGKIVPQVLGKIVPVLNGKLQTHYGVISPFTRQFIGTGVEVSVHASLPVEIEGKMSQGQIDLSIRSPTEVERTGVHTKVHGSVMPYTFKYNWLSVTPISHSTQLWKIVSGIKRKPVIMEVGQSLGISARVQWQSDAQFVDMFSYIQKIIQHTPLTVIPSGIFPSSARMSSVSFEYFPKKSEVKEFHFVVRLSTKGMMHSLSKKIIAEEQIPSQFLQVKSVLPQLEKANIVEIMGMTKSSSGSELKKIHTVIVLGKKGHHAPHKGPYGESDLADHAPQSETHLAAAEVLPTGAAETIAIHYEGKIELPTLLNRWNVQKMLEQPLKGGFQGEIMVGKPGQLKGIKVVAKLEKSEELKRQVRESPEFKQCLAEMGKQKWLTPICTIARLQAASMDKIHLTINTPVSWSKWSIMNLLDGAFKAILLGNVESEKVISGTEGVTIAEARADRVSQTITSKVITPTREFLLRNMRFMGYARFFLPATAIRNPLEVASLKLSGDMIPSTCRVEPSFIRTFDNMTVQYPINDCEHVLLLDGSKHIPIAVTTRTVESQKKIVKVLSGVTEVQMIPVSGSMKVLVNGQPITLPAIGKKFIKKSSEGKVILIVRRFEDNVVYVNIPKQHLQVLSDGSRIEVVAPWLLKSRTVGLCGDMNGERSADLKTPGMCVLRPRLAALSFMLNKSGAETGWERCSGLPAALKEEFIRESTKCPREVIVPTPISKLHERISLLNQPAGMKHIVEKQPTKVCISKQMVKTCLSKPLSIKQRSFEFACLPWPSVLARSFEKRALAGEVLIRELSQLPTVFRKVEFEPVACKSEMSSITL